MESISILESPHIRHIHFIGIGGISMSGLAEILMNMGYKVSGSDMKPSNITQKLQEAGAKITIGHSPDNIESPDLVVYTAAVKNDNPELVKARSLGIPVIDRASLLGEIMKRYPCSIAVSGTHGKTTTTSMITMIMLQSGLNPTVHIGGELDAIGGNTRIGSGRYFITEACEYVESFLKFYPFLAVVLNIEADHLDYFKDIEHVKEAFLKFVSLVPADGYVIACSDDENVLQVLEKVSCNKITYGIKSKNAIWTAKEITFDDMGRASFKTMVNGRFFADIKLNIPGVHNVNNALAAIAACSVLGCGTDDIRRGLERFFGARRRFEFKGEIDGIKVIDDYAHHPSEVKATLKAARNTRHKKVWCVFQPHTYTRTKVLLDEFSTAFLDSDFVIVSDIYAAREADTGEIHSCMLAEKIGLQGQKALYIKGFDNIVDYLAENASPGDMIITMGAGDIYKVGEMFLQKRAGDTSR